jgi:hypothetical protein
MSDPVPNPARTSALNIVIASDISAKPLFRWNLQPLLYLAARSHTAALGAFTPMGQARYRQ